MRRTAVSQDSHEVAQLDAPDRLARQRIEWWCERGGWALMALFLGASAAGLLGPGLVSRQRQASHSGRAVCEYEGWIRCQSPSELRILRPAAEGANTVRLGIPQRFLELVTIDEVIPRPSHEVAGDGNVTYLLQVRGDAPIEVRFQARQPGSVALSLMVDEESIPIRLVIFP